MMVQRALAAKSLSHAQGGCLLAGYFKFAFLVRDDTSWNGRKSSLAK